MMPSCLEFTHLLYQEKCEQNRKKKRKMIQDSPQAARQLTMETELVES